MFATVYVYIVSFYFYFYPDPDLCHLPYLISDDDPQSLCKGCDQGTSSRLNLSVFCRTIRILIFMLFHRVNVYRVTNVKCQSMSIIIVKLRISASLSRQTPINE